MPATSDHDRRDALAAAYAEIGLFIGRYRRRFFEAAKATVNEEIERAELTGEEVDGTAIGRAAASAAIAQYLGPEIHEAVEGAAAGAGGQLGPGEGS